MSELFDFKAGELVDGKVTGAEGPWLMLILTWQLPKLILGCCPCIADVDEVCLDK